MEIIALSIVALISFALCGLVVRFGPRDEPDGDRKTQQRAVPSAGGAAIIVTIAVVLIFVSYGPMRSTLYYLGKMGVFPHIVLILGAGLIGLVDDVFGMPARVKLAGLAGLALIAASMGFRVMELNVPGLADAIVLTPLVGILGTALWLFVMMNAVNFMDGSNGLAMGSLAIMLAAVAFFLLIAGTFGGVAGPASGMLFICVAAIIGFLPWNMSGRLYVGDTGALALGAVLASACVFAFEGYVWVSAALALPFLIDVFLTLLWRQRAGRHLMHAHRDHAYQLFVRAGWPHWRVAVLWWAMTALCIGVIVALNISKLDPAFSSFASFAVPLVIGCVLWCWQRATLGRRLAAEGR